MSETNPPPAANPPVETPPVAPPVTPPAAPPVQPPAASATPPGSGELGGLLTRLETVLTGLPERTANAVREVSPQHVPNPTASPQQPPASQTPPPAEKSKGGPSRVARWYHGIK
jgi:hypothetical protein